MVQFTDRNRLPVIKGVTVSDMRVNVSPSKPIMRNSAYGGEQDKSAFS